jgi:hypothetical protein
VSPLQKFCPKGADPLRFHNVPMRDKDKQRTDNIIVDIVKSKMKMINFSVDDINRSHIIGNINQEKGEQELLTRPEQLNSPPVFSWVRVTRSLVLCVCFVDRCLSFVLSTVP